MPGRKKPSFLKRQKEMTRVARANEKRDARRARKHAKGLGGVGDPERAEIEESADTLLGEPGPGDPDEGDPDPTPSED